MLPSSMQRSYVARSVKEVVILSLLLAALTENSQATALTPSLAPSISTPTPTAVAHENITPTTTMLLGPSTVPPSRPRNVSFQISIQILNAKWSEKLLNRQSSEFRILAENTTRIVSEIFKNEGHARVEVAEFKPGSVIAVINVSASAAHKAAIKKKLENDMKDGTLGQLKVDPVLYSGSLFDAIVKVKTPCRLGFGLSANLTKAISNAMSSNPRFLKASVQAIECPEPKNVSVVTVRLQLDNPKSSNPNEELKPLKDEIARGQLGNFSVVPEWRSYIPGEKLFFLYVPLKNQSCDEDQTRQSLQTFVDKEFENVADYKYSNVKMDGCDAIVEIGMKSSSSELTAVSLKPMADHFHSGKFGSIEFVKKTLRGVIDSRSLTAKIFQVQFHQMVHNCEATKVNDSKTELYKNLSHGAWRYVDHYMRKNTKYIETKVTSLSCFNTTMVMSSSYVFLEANSTDLFREVAAPLYDCKEPGIYEWGLMVILVTPTLPRLISWIQPFVGPHYHVICTKFTKPTLTTTPTRNTTTSGPTTKAESTSKTLTTPSSKTNAANTSQQPTTKVTQATLPPLDSKPTLYVKLKLGITWGEFCSKLGDSLKQRIAFNLFDKYGSRISSDRVIFINFRRNCVDSRMKDKQAEVWFYLSKKSGSRDLHTCLTLKAYKLFSMFLENGNTKQLGPEFAEKVVHVELAGSNASKYKNRDEDDGKMSTLTTILVAVAGAFGFFLMMLACCCLFCCGRIQRTRRRAYEKPYYLHAVQVNGDGASESGSNDKGKRGVGNGSKGGENDCEKKTKEGKGKDGCDNDGYDSVGKQKRSNKGADTRKGGVTPDNKSKLKDNDQTNAKAIDSKENGTHASLNQHRGENEGNHGNATKLGSDAPVIVASSTPHLHRGNVVNDDKITVGKSPGAASISLGGSRRGSSSTGGRGQGDAPIASGSPGLRQMDADLIDRERRRSSVHSLLDDEAVPLTHKTGTVGIVALALRNKNEKKKETEFKNLNKDVPNEEMKYPPNTASKNRSPDVLPAPKTRVKLSTTPDYINANWIKDHKGKKCYIATQHPLPETMDDFWRMAWDEQAKVVVMVNEEENEKPAHFKDYLPKDKGGTRVFGGIEVTIKNVTKKPDYILTALDISDSKNRASAREVSHFRFTSWKERAMPNVALFVGFVTATREARDQTVRCSAPIIVHCSDGLGFSGVFIAVDIGIKSHEESKTSVVDVFELSKNLRRDRHGIVCSLDHYNFIYQALYEYTVNYDKTAE